MKKRACTAALVGLTFFAVPSNTLAQPAPSTVIAYSGQDGAIWKVGANGQQTEIVVAPPPGEKFARPRWSPDGHSLVFDGYPANSDSLSVDAHYVWHDDGFLVRIDRIGLCSSPSFAQNGDRLAFVCSPMAPTGVDLFMKPPPPDQTNPDPSFNAVTTTELDGSDWQPLVPWGFAPYPDPDLLPWGAQAAPETLSFSPDGTLEVDVRSVGPSGFFALADGDGSGFHAVQVAGGGQSYSYKRAVFARDGSTLFAFRCTKGCGIFPGGPSLAEIVHISRAGETMGPPMKLPDDTSPSRLSLSPDGSSLTYSAFGTDATEWIWVASLAGGNPLRLARGADPDWQPIKSE
jgi:hypothetical protein